MSKSLKGTVIKTNRSKTIVVAIPKKMSKTKIGRFHNRIIKMHVHDEKELAKSGDNVLIRSSRPMSKQKFFVLEKIYVAGKDNNDNIANL